MPITPMPADTLRHNTSQSSQNCRVCQACPTVIDSVAACVPASVGEADGVADGLPSRSEGAQPEGAQPSGGTR